MYSLKDFFSLNFIMFHKSRNAVNLSHACPLSDSSLSSHFVKKAFCFCCLKGFIEKRNVWFAWTVACWLISSFRWSWIQKGCTGAPEFCKNKSARKPFRTYLNCIHRHRKGEPAPLSVLLILSEGLLRFSNIKFYLIVCCFCTRYCVEIWSHLLSLHYSSSWPREWLRRRQDWSSWKRCRARPKGKRQRKGSSW